MMSIEDQVGKEEEKETRLGYTMREVLIFPHRAKVGWRRERGEIIIDSFMNFHSSFSGRGREVNFLFLGL